MAKNAFHGVVAAVGLVLAAGGGWWWMNRSPSASEPVSANPSASASAPGAAASGAVRPVGVEVAKVERATLRDDAQSVGSLRSRQSVVLRPEVAGRVLRIGFADGSPVRRGQILVQLDDTLQLAEIRQSRAQVSIAAANHKRNQELVAQNFVAQRVLDESSAALQVAEAQWSLACARWERMRIVAPFDGTVGIRSINVGDYVKDGADLVNLEDIGSLYVDFRLPERFQGRVRTGQEVELQIDAMPGRQFRARIEAVDPLIDANGRSVAVRALMPNTAGEAAAPARGASAAASASAGRPGGATSAAIGQSGARPSGAGGDRGAGTGSMPGRARPGAGGRGGAAGEAMPGAVVGSAPGIPASESPCPSSAASRVSPGGAERPSAQGGPLRPGMFARVTAVFGVRENALTVPEEAIVPLGGRQFVVRVVTAPSGADAGAGAMGSEPALISQRVEVRLGLRRPGRVEILDGVAEGDTVVIAGQQRLQRDGSPVRLVDLGRSAGRPPAGGASGAASGVAGGVAPASAAAGPQTPAAVR